MKELLRWVRLAPRGETPYWMRYPEPGETEGLDQASGLVIAYSEEERARLDKLRLAA